MLGNTIVRQVSLGDEVVICEGPAVILAVAASEAGGGEPAIVSLRGLDGAAYLTLSVSAGQTVSATPHCTAPHGLVLAITSGSAVVSLSYV